MTPQEISIDTGALRLAARAWGPEDGRPVLALHGWLDNAATWDRLAPLLIEAGAASGAGAIRLVSLDFPGHGRSAHFAPGAWYGFPDYVMSVVRVLDALGWDRVTLLGHSMGGAVATMTAAVIPERVAALALVEGLTPLTSTDDAACESLRKGLISNKKYGAQTARVYPDLAAIESRFAARPWKLTPPAVQALAARGCAPVEGGWAFTHDPRLKAASLVRFNPDQVHSFLVEVACPTLLFVGDDGLQYRKEEVANYLDSLADVRTERVAGRHHVHLDAPELVLPSLLQFLAETA